MSLVRMMGVAGLVLLTASVASAQDCTRELAEAQRVAGSVKIDLVASLPTKVGSSFALKWRASQSTFSSAPVYLVAATEDDARFAGTGFLALTPGAVAPRKVAYGRGRSRVFVPLDRQISAGKGGEIGILPQSVRKYITTVAVVYAGACGEKVLSEATYPVAVTAGAASVLVQDRSAATASAKAIQAIDRKHILRVFAERYEVSNATTGDLVLAGSGRDPNFSPTGRFFAVEHIGDAGFDVFDLSGSPRPLLRDAAGDVHALIWANSDSYLVVSGQRWGHLNVFNTIVDADAFHFGIDSCHGCSGAESSYVVIDLDRGYAANFPIGEVNSVMSDGKIPISDLYRRTKTELVSPEQAASHVRLNYDGGFGQFPATWSMAGGPLYSHLSIWEPSMDEIRKAGTQAARKA